MIKLVLSKSEKLDSSFVDSIRKSGSNVIAVLSLKPYYQLKQKINPACKNKKCLFFDTISKPLDSEVIYLPGENLTALSIAINQAQQSFNGKVTVLFDSITSLSIKNDVSTLIKFFSFLFYKSRDWNSDLVLVLPNEGVDESLLSIIKQSADKIQKR